MKPTLLAVALSLAAAACSGDANESTDTTASTTSTESTDTTASTTSTESGREGTGSTTTAALEPNATIERVVDGDTVIVDVGGTRERVRLIGIDTPESVAENRPDQCFGAEAAAYLEALLPEGTPITLILDEEPRDQYDRLLAYVVRSDDQLFVNLDLIEQGYAGTLFYPPNTFYADRFGEAVAEAEASGTGLWGVCGGPDVPLE